METTRIFWRVGPQAILNYAKKSRVEGSQKPRVATLTNP